MRRVEATSSYTVDFRRSCSAAVSDPQPEGRVRRVARLLALAHKIDGLIRAGELRDLAHAARALGVSRARVTQIMNLLLLAPEIQEAILDLPRVVKGRDPVTERQLREIVAEPGWELQLAMWSGSSRVRNGEPD